MKSSMSIIHLLIVIPILISNIIINIEATQQSPTINSNPPYSQSNFEEQSNYFHNKQQNHYQLQKTENNSNFNSNFTNGSGSGSSSSSSSSTIESMPNFYTNSQASKFRVNVSNICEKNHMHVTIRLNKPFYGLIHTKDRRKKLPCFIEGNGEQTYLLDISYTLIQSDLNYCGVVSHHLNTTGSLSSKNKNDNNQQATLSVVLVVRLHKTIEFSDDRYFLLSCANRCSILDCSNNESNNIKIESNKSLQIANNTNLNLIASETIVSPISRSSTRDRLLSQNDNNKLASLDSSSGTSSWFTTTTSSDKCDIMLDLKFQFLVIVCCILFFLLILMFFIIFYQCFRINNEKSTTAKMDRSKLFDEKKKNKNEKMNFNNKLSDSKKKQIKATTSYAQSENLSWSTLTTGQTTSDELNINNKSTREDDSYLEHQQKLKLINLMPNSNNNINTSNKNHLKGTNGNPIANNGINYNGIDMNSITGDPTQHKAFMATTVNHNNHNNNLILGRSIDPSFGGTQRIKNSNGNVGFIKRRRSIGGSSTMPIILPETSNERQQTQLESTGRGQLIDDYNLNRFDLNHRAKSRSHTTIYYEQNQDPFKAIPFNYLNNGYLSDNNNNNNSNQHQHNLLNKKLDNNNNYLNSEGTVYLDEQYLILPNSQRRGQYLDETITNSLPPENIQLNSNNLSGNQFIDSKRWLDNKSSYVPLQMQQQLIHRQQIVNSQFDPQQNSHQLIDLIQQKHRQQIEQANRTAATLVASSKDQLFNQQVANSNRQLNQQLNGQHNNHHHHHNRAW